MVVYDQNSNQNLSAKSEGVHARRVLSGRGLRRFARTCPIRFWGYVQPAWRIGIKSLFLVFDFRSAETLALAGPASNLALRSVRVPERPALELSPCKGRWLASRAFEKALEVSQLGLFG